MKPLLAALLFAALPRPCVETLTPASPLAYTFFHNGTEQKIPIFVGKGPDRQVLIFCLHLDPEVPFEQWPAHVVNLFDYPEPLPSPPAKAP